MTLHLRISSKLSIFQIYISVKISSVCKLLKFIKSDFATNFEDYMSFNTENGNKTQCHRYKRWKFDFRTEVNSKKTLFGLDITNMP